MAVTKKIEIDEKEVGFKASAAVFLSLQDKFLRDVYKDMISLNDAIAFGG